MSIALTFNINVNILKRHSTTTTTVASLPSANVLFRRDVTKHNGYLEVGSIVKYKVYCYTIVKMKNAYEILLSHSAYARTQLKYRQRVRLCLSVRRSRSVLP